jgi:Transposase domain (DUF772)
VFADRAAIDPAGEAAAGTMLLQAFYSIRSERLLMERLEYDVLFRWFVGIGIDDAPWNHSVFSKNRDGCWRATSRRSSWRRCLAQPKVLRGCDRVGWAFTFAAAAHNLVRLRSDMTAPAGAN